MAEMKYLNTRVQLKYDSHANWTKNNPTLLAGEIAIAYLGPTHTETTPDNKTHPVLFKVGPGNFNSLPWASALAADVYAWAKQENLPIVRASNDGDTEGNVISGISWNETEGKIEYTTASVATSEGMEELQKTINDNKDKWAKDTEYTFTEIEDADGNIVGIDITSNQGASGSGQSINFDFVTDQSLTTILSNYYTKDEVDDLIPVIIGAGAIEVSPTATGVEIGLDLDNTGNVKFSESEAGLKADIDLSAYRKIADDENTAHTHAAGAGIKLNSNSENGGIDGEVKLDLNIAMELAEKTIKIYDKDDTNKTAIATLDATSFIKDGMIESVELVQENDKGTKGQFLKITWNIDDANVTDADSEKDVIYINVGDLVDVYTGSAGADITVTVSNQNVISATLNKTFAEKSELSGYKTKQENKAGTLTGAQVLSSWAQNENGEVGFQTRSLTPADIGAQPAGSYQPAGDYKTKQQAHTEAGSTAKTVTNIIQNENGEIAVTYGDIAFPAPPVVNDGKFTVSGTGALSGSGEMTANQSGDTTAALDVKEGGIDTARLADKAVTTAKIADNAIGAKQLKAEQGYTGTDAEVWVFCCGDSTTLV